MHKQAKGSILLLLCAMIWGAAFVAQSESMQYIGPFTMGAARFFLAGLVLLPVIAVLDRQGWSQNRPVTGAEKKKQLLSGMISKVMPALPVVFIAAPGAILLALLALVILVPSIISIWAEAVMGIMQTDLP